MSTPTVYVICDKNCKFEGMTKEQILTAIAQAVESGEIKDVDAGFVSTIKTINGKPLKFFVGSQAEYDALTDEEKNNLFALITNDTTKEGLLAAIEELNTRVGDLETWKTAIMDEGTQAVKRAEEADRATEAVKLAPTIQTVDVDFTKTSPNIDILLELGKNYLISVQYDNSFISNGVTIPSAVCAASFFIAVPHHHVGNNNTRNWIFESTVSQVYDSESDTNTKDLKIRCVYSDGTIYYYLYERNNSGNWELFSLPANSENKYVTFRVYELFADWS